MPAFGVPTQVTTLLAAFKAKLLADAVVAASSQIITGLRDDDELFYNQPTYPFITLRIAAFPANLPAIAGGTIETEQYDAILRVSLWSFIGQDWSELQHDVLEAALLAEIVLWKSVLKSLRKYMPYNADADGLLIEPMRNVSWEPSQPRPDRKGWVKFIGQYSFRFVQDLT